MKNSVLYGIFTAMNHDEQIILAIIEKKPQTKAQFDRARMDICSELKISQPGNRDLLEAYQKLVKKRSIEPDKLIEELLKKATIRSLSGIAIVTSLVKPYTCPGKCVYCPTEVRMPKSYIATEPAAARALRLDFSPYEQMRQRILVLEKNGHPTDKLEYIIKGGTWNAYPIKYQYWFMLESFRACNEVGKNALSRVLERVISRKDTLTEHSPFSQLQKALEKEQTKNETAKHRIIGVTLETRPDNIVPKTIKQMREQGCTRVELGLQAPDDKILELIVRGHTVQHFRDAMFLLRQAGFKVDLHFMPDLPGTTPEHDVEMYKSLFTDPGLKPDMVKIYPNTVIPSAELYQWFLDGRYKPYGDENLFNALLQMKLATPRYCRISRLIRDIPSTEIAAGNSITNLRELLEARLKQQGKKCECLRCREIGRQKEKVDLRAEPVLFVESYETTGGTEYFLTFEDPKRIAVYAFLRLRIPNHVILSGAAAQSKDHLANNIFQLMPEIDGCAFIRELHTYGQMVEIGDRNEQASQHKGLGKKLIEKAEAIVKENGFAKVAVISGVGVRGYYRKWGYRKKGTYMIKSI